MLSGQNDEVSAVKRNSYEKETENENRGKGTRKVGKGKYEFSKKNPREGERKKMEVWQKRRQLITVNFQPSQGSNICNLTLSCEIHLGNIDQDPFSLPQAIQTFLDSVYVQK